MCTPVLCVCRLIKGSKMYTDFYLIFLYIQKAYALGNTVQVVQGIRTQTRCKCIKRKVWCPPLNCWSHPYAIITAHTS
jgi:hypothetical protein